jgi:hypothetical protein
MFLTYSHFLSYFIENPIKMDNSPPRQPPPPPKPDPLPKVAGETEEEWWARWDAEQRRQAAVASQRECTCQPGPWSCSFKCRNQRQ